MALSACALAPSRYHAELVGHGPPRSAIPLTLALALFFPAFFGNDASNVMTPSEVNTVLAFLKSAKPGPLLAVIGNMPASDTAGYDEFDIGTIFDAYGIVPRNHSIPDMPVYAAQTLSH